MSQPKVRPTTQAEVLEFALQSAGIGHYYRDVAGDYSVVSEGLAAITGLPAGRMPLSGGLAMNVHIHPDDLQAFRKAQQEQSEKGGAYNCDLRFQRPDDQSWVWLNVAGVVTLGPDGKPASVMGIVRDISLRKLEEERRQTLMGELDHRVKNVLATVQALAQQTAKRTTSLEVFLQNFGGRLKAMASANELLTAARWRGAAVDHLVAAELGAMDPGQTQWDGPELFLTSRAANALSMALHELSTNAVKFGALSTDTGQVRVRWHRCTDGGFELTWTESGGPTVSFPPRKGFGSTLLNQVTGRELNGATVIDYPPAGVRARLKAGAPAVAPRPENVPHAPAARVAETVVAASGPTSLKGARVLIVEDAVLLALELEMGLSDAGAQVVGPAYELEEAMGLLDRPIDAAVLDANLNGHSVTPVAQVLSDRGIPFVFATGYGESGGAPGGFDAPVIRKPYDVTQVAAAVAALLAAKDGGA